MEFFLGIGTLLKKAIVHPWAFFLAVICLFVSTLAASLHYAALWSGNPLVWIAWISSVALLIYSFSPGNGTLLHALRSVRRSDILLILLVILVFFLSHTVNFSTAPWNQNGLFDDAAWDIYFAKNHVFTAPFQAAFFDSVGLISREVVFHYYISAWFVLFGYNVLVFNCALLFLGFLTVFFTTLLIHKMLRNIVVTVCAFSVLNFFPLHFMHIFMGHRYAIAAPLMMISFYSLYTGYTRKSYVHMVLSALFAALCFGSAVMGKQYLMGLFLGVLWLFVSTRSLWKSTETYTLSIVWVFAFLVSASPLLLYILWNYPSYILREQSLLHEFSAAYHNAGIMGFQPYIDQLRELFFAPFTYKRQFLTDFYPIPFVYYLLLVPGIALAFIRKRFEIAFLALLPVFGAFVSGSYDFRILLAVPFWVICMAYTMNACVSLWKRKTHWRIQRIAVCVLGAACILFGFVPSVRYIWNVSKTPDHQYLLSHRDVAVSRLVQDIVVGSPHPTSGMKWDELNRYVLPTALPYDTFVSPYGAYAVMHVFLQNYDDARILSFINGGIQLHVIPQDALRYHIQAITSYVPRGKDLKLVIEVSDRSQAIIDLFRQYGQDDGYEELYTESVDGIPFSVWTLTIRQDAISRFQERVRWIDVEAIRGKDR